MQYNSHINDTYSDKGEGSVCYFIGFDLDIDMINKMTDKNIHMQLQKCLVKFGYTQPSIQKVAHLRRILMLTEICRFPELEGSGIN